MSTKRNDLTNEMEAAIAAGSIPRVKSFLQKIPADFKFERGRTPLHVASKLGKNSVITFLLKEKQTKLDAGDYKGNTPLHLAAVEALTSTVQLLLEAGASVSIENTYGEIALQAAAGGNRKFPARVKSATALLDAGSPIDHSNLAGQTALHIAAMHGNAALVALLLSRGAYTNHVAVGNLGTPDQTAEAFGHAEIAERIRMHRGG